MKVFLILMFVTPVFLTGCAEFIVANLVVGGAVALSEKLQETKNDASSSNGDTSNVPASVKSTIEECIERYNGGRPHSNAIHFCELAMANGKGGEYQVADMYEQGSGGAYTNKSKALRIYKQCATKNTSLPSEVNTCNTKAKMLEETLQVTPKPIIVYQASIQATKEIASPRDLKEQLKEAKAKEAADKRNKILEAKQAAAKEATEKLEQKRAESARLRSEKMEAERLFAEARRGDGSSGDIHCKELKLAPTTPKYLNCRKEFSDSEAIARKIEQDNRRALEQAKVGDGTSEHKQCLKFGFIGSTPPYADCRLRLEMNKQQVAQRQAAYEAEQQRYEEQVAAFEKEKERQKKLARIRYGLALMGSDSPTFAGGIADANRAMGWAPPEPPKLQPFMIQGPNGMTTCTVIGNMYSCN